MRVTGLQLSLLLLLAPKRSATTTNLKRMHRQSRALRRAATILEIVPCAAQFHKK
jgi:hypothetical protein